MRARSCLCAWALAICRLSSSSRPHSTQPHGLAASEPTWSGKVFCEFASARGCPLSCVRSLYLACFQFLQLLLHFLVVHSITFNCLFYRACVTLTNFAGLIPDTAPRLWIAGGGM